MRSRLLLIAYSLSGLAALVYELGWMRELSAMLGATAYASGTMLGAYMAGLGLGGLAGLFLAAKLRRPLVGASWAELAVAALSVVAFAGIRFLPPAYFDWMRRVGTGTAAHFLTLQFGICFSVMLLPTFAMGTTYPLIMRAVCRDNRVGSLAGKLYAVNTAGAIIGSLLATFAFLPTVGVKGSLVIAAVLSVLAAWLLRAVSGQELSCTAFVKSPQVLAALGALTAIALIPARTGSPLGLGQAFYYHSSQAFDEKAGQRRTLFDREGIYSRVQVTQNPDGSRTLSNGALDEGTDNDYDRVTTTMIAAVPAESVQTSPAAASAMVVGLGTGYTSQTYRRLGFGRVVTVEINPDVLPASDYFLDDRGAADPASWQVIVDDARAWLLTSTERFDCISSEPSWPWSSGVAALFTREFMTAAASRLKPGGVYCQWLPNYLLEGPDVTMMYKTMATVFPRVDVWSINFGNATSAELLLVGHTSDQGFVQSAVKERLDELIATDVFDNSQITTASITPLDAVDDLRAAAAAADVPLNVDDHSTLEYRVFWNYLNRAFLPSWGSGGSVLTQ
ncbi:MAG: fused MFS/spermidine synthase [Actinomycetes bacterium]|jgi:spermidine synthase|nr:fused MFS/spermidine synthase [Actinomycetes bacterium]